jgi:hypothetical protein
MMGASGCMNIRACLAQQCALMPLAVRDARRVGCLAEKSVCGKRMPAIGLVVTTGTGS